MSVLVFSTIMSEIVLIIRRVILKIILINVQTSSYKVHVILIIFQYILNFLDRISKSKNVRNVVCSHSIRCLRHRKSAGIPGAGSFPYDICL